MSKLFQLLVVFISNSDFQGFLDKDDCLGKGGPKTSQMPAPRPLSKVPSDNSIDFDFQGGLRRNPGPGTLSC